MGELDARMDIRIDSDLKKRIRAIVDDNPVDYPTDAQFIRSSIMHCIWREEDLMKHNPGIRVEYRHQIYEAIRKILALKITEQTIESYNLDGRYIRRP